jgi:hypothetical protein
MIDSNTNLQNLLYKPMIGIVSYFGSAGFFLFSQSLWF